MVTRPAPSPAPISQGPLRPRLRALTSRDGAGGLLGALLLALLCAAVFAARAPRADAPPLSDGRWDRHFHALERDAAGRAFRWMGPTAALRLSRLSTGHQRLTLTVQNARPDGAPVPVRLSGLVSAQITAAPGERIYALLLPATAEPAPDVLNLAGESFRPGGGDRRLLSVVLRGARIEPIGPGLPWWPVTAAAMLAQVGLVALALRGVGARGWQLLLAAGAPALMLAWLLREGGYGPGAATTAWMITGTLGAATAIIRARLPTEILAIRPARWARADYLLAGGVAAGAVALRAALLPYQIPLLNGDDYLTGSFAANIVQRGWHALYFGSHTGALAAYLAAPALALGGVTVQSLMLLPLALTAALTVALYGLGRDLAGRWGGLAAALWIALPAATPLIWTMKPQPGYLEAITFAALALWGSVRLLWGAQRGRRAVALMAGVALSATLAIWAGMVVASVMLVCAGMAAARWRRAAALPLAGHALGLAIALLLLVPTAVYIVERPGDNPLWWVVGRDQEGMPPGQAFVGLVTRLQPLTLGATRPFPLPPMPALGSALLLGLAGMSLLFALYAALRRARAPLIALGIVLGVTLLFCFSSFNTLLTDARYVLPLYLALPLLTAFLVAACRAQAGRAPAALLSAAGWPSSWRPMRGAAWAGCSPGRPRRRARPPSSASSWRATCATCTPATGSPSRSWCSAAARSRPPR